MPKIHLPDAWPRGMRLEIVAAYVGVSPRAWTDLVRYGKAPAGFCILRRRRIWLKEDVDAWLDQRAMEAVSAPRRPVFIKPPSVVTMSEAQVERRLRKHFESARRSKRSRHRRTTKGGPK